MTPTNSTNPVLSLLRSRKFVLLILAVAQTIILSYTTIKPEVWQAIDALIAVLIASIAWEDSAEKSAVQTIDPAQMDELLALDEEAKQAWINK